MTNIKPCPFCGQQPVMTTDDEPQVYCDTRDCAGPIADSVTEWQTRPIEDALTARIAELEAIILEASNAYNLPGAEPDTDVDIAAVALVRMCHEGRAALDDATCPYCELLAETQQRVRDLEAAFTYPDGMRHDGPPQP